MDPLRADLEVLPLCDAWGDLFLSSLPRLSFTLPLCLLSNLIISDISLTSSLFFFSNVHFTCAALTLFSVFFKPLGLFLSSPRPTWLQPPGDDDGEKLVNRFAVEKKMGSTRTKPPAPQSGCFPRWVLPKIDCGWRVSFDRTALRYEFNLFTAFSAPPDK